MTPATATPTPATATPAEVLDPETAAEVAAAQDRLDEHQGEMDDRAFSAGLRDGRPCQCGRCNRDRWALHDAGLAVKWR